MNPVGLELFGYTQEDLKKSLKSSQLVIFVDRKKLLKNKQKILQEENVLGAKYIALKKDGTTFDVYVDSIPISHNNQIVGTRGIAVNISK
jgi:PAS domain S-box-containing protein